MAHSFLEFQSIVNENLNQIRFTKEPINLYEPISYVLKSGGKRIRPILCLMSCEMFNAEYYDALHPALGIEIFHNFTLLHDDIMDNADARRGMETVHIKWNENTAILSGDAMSIIAYMFVAKAKNNLSQIIDTFSESALKICEGQQFDMDFENTNNTSKDEYLEMIGLKTAELLACSLKIGALCANADSQNCQDIYDFGYNLGMAFQLQDDLLDVYGDYEKLGKKIGKDIEANKKTYLLIHALNTLQGEDMKELYSWLEAEKFDYEHKLKRVTHLFNMADVKRHTQNLINQYFDEADNIALKLTKKNINLEKITTFVNSLKKRDS